MITLTRRYKFDAAHHLPTLPEHHPCHRMHGHTYVVWLTVTGPVVDGMVIEYGDLDDIWRHQCALVLDHHTLNDVPGLENPTVEILTPWIFKRLAPNMTGGVCLESVRVQESESSSCEYRP